MTMPSVRGEPRNWCLFLNPKQASFEKYVSAAVHRGGSDFYGGMIPDDQNIGFDGQTKAVREFDFLPSRVPLLYQRSFERATRKAVI